MILMRPSVDLQRALIGIFVIAFATVFASTVIAVPVDRSTTDESAVSQSLEEQLRNVSFTGAIPGVLASQPISGDTVYAICSISEFQFSSGFNGSDCWGYTSGGIDYAIMGMANGVVFIDVTNGVIVDTAFGPSCLWRDMVTAGSYCYGVSECGDGLTVIDLQFLPDSVHVLSSLPTDGSGYFWSHNISVDSIAGYLYIEGYASANRKILIHDISDPANPVFVTGFDVPGGSVHDVYAADDIVYTANGSSASYSIWDLSNKFNAQELTTWGSPSGGYAHNIWPTDDGRHVVTTEETPGRTVKIWNVEDLGNILLVGEYLGPSSLAHNVHVKGDLVYISHYESGLRVIDISDPSNPIEVGAFDTHPEETPNYAGAWGVFPFSPNDYIYVSNMDERLFVLKGKTAIINDTMIVEIVAGTRNSDVRVDIYAANSQDTRYFMIPLSWAGSGDLSWDSVSVVGLRTEYFEQVNLVSINPFAKEGAWTLTSSLTGTSPPLAPGAGPILSLYFSVGSSAPDGLAPVVFKSINGAVPILFDECALVITPDTLSGGILVSSSCCDTPGDADNNGATGIGDVTFLIARIFSGGSAPACCEEGDADFSAAITIGDVTYLIAYIFSGGPSPVCGPAVFSCGAQ